MGPGMRLGLDIRLEPEQRQEFRLEQELEITLKLRLQDPLEYARELFGRSQKVKVPLTVGKYTMLIDAAIVPQHELEKMFEGESFSGIISRDDERYLFFNRTLRVPDSVRPAIPKLMAFHCLAAIRMPDFGDGSGTLRQFQAIALEMAYAGTLMGPGRYREYEKWRPSVERSPFFMRDDWPEIVSKTHSRFRDVVEPLHRNAHRAKFAVMMHGETFRLGPGGKAVGRDGEIEVHRKIRPQKI